MQDRETESLWSQISGKCIKGQMAGRSLDLYPSTMTTFAEFRKQYPDGMLLAKDEKGKQGSPYDRYFADPSRLGVFGRVDDFKRLKGKDKVFGIRYQSSEAAVSLEYLKEHKYAVINQFSPAVAVCYDDNSETAAAFVLPDADSLSIAGLQMRNRVLRFGGDSAAAWNASTGLPLSGGQRLEQVPLISAYWFAWAEFFPSSALIK